MNSRIWSGSRWNHIAIEWGRMSRTLATPDFARPRIRSVAASSCFFAVGHARISASSLGVYSFSTFSASASAALLVSVVPLVPKDPSGENYLRFAFSGFFGSGEGAGVGTVGAEGVGSAGFESKSAPVWNR